MGSCISDPLGSGSRRPANLTNPIKMTVFSKSIQLLRAKWDREQLQLLQGKVSTLVGAALPFERFLQVFPKLAGLSEITQKKYFRLLAYEGSNQISRKELMNALTIIKKVEHSRFLAPLIYFVYTAEPAQPAMTEQEFQFFQEENKAYANNLENFDEVDPDHEEEIEIDDLDLDGPDKEIEASSNPHENHHTHLNGTNGTNGHHKPKKGSQPSNPSQIALSSDGSPPPSRKRLIAPSEFQKIFSGYNLQHYQILFSWSLPQQQRELVSVFLRQGLAHRKGEKVFLVEYQWFLSWKAYAEQEYQVRIDLREEEAEINYMSYKSATRRKSKDEIRVDPPSSQRLEGRAAKPGEIKNFILKYGRKDNELVENMVQFQNYICVKEEVWRRMVAIYNGGPAIERVYPKIYYNVIVKVTVQASGRFLPRSSRKIESKQRPTVSGYALSSELAHACFYKYPGKKNWKELEDVSTSSEEVFNSPRTYLAFVPRPAVTAFIFLHNIREGKEQKLLKERFANYGSEVNFSIDGVMNRGEVVEIEDAESITVEYIDEQGNVRRRTIANDQDFQKFNPENLLDEGQLNELSGLDNIGNTCYMNAVIQCLIRTPFFGNYLQQENFADAKDEQLLVEEIARIYKKSKTNSHASINTKSFKRVFEKHCPYFEGNSQHDAQEFLLCLLERLMEEINSKREEFGVNSEVRRSGAEDKNANKKVVKFFSGKTEAVTTCRQCNNKGVRVESFFTYSLSLPEQPVVEFYYHYVPLYRAQRNTSLTPLLCGITLSRKATVEHFIAEVSKQRRLKNCKLALFTVFNNEILNKLQFSSFHKEVGYYLHFNAKLVCFEVENEDTPTFYDYQRRQLKGKSVKIELRQRIYSEKSQEYKIIYQPFILEVTEGMFWKDVEEDVRTILQKLESKRQSDILQATPMPSHVVTAEKGLGVSEIKVSASSIRHTTSLNESPYNFNKNGQSLIRNTYQGSPASTPSGTVSSSASQSYKIRVIKSDHLYENSCVFCKQDFVIAKRSFSKRACKGCSFDASTLLLEQAQFRNICDNIIITVDWQQSIPQFEKFAKHESYEYCLQLAESRKDVLKDLLFNNFNTAEQLQLRCEKEGCQYGLASRTEKISIYPNILLLHLKRFTYEDNMLVKLNNSVIYPETLELASEAYQLYGVVSHMGSGVGGHYISFVRVTGKWYKCDDNRVRLATGGQHIDSNAYLLFYKRKEFEPVLMTLSF